MQNKKYLIPKKDIIIYAIISYIYIVISVWYIGIQEDIEYYRLIMLLFFIYFVPGIIAMIINFADVQNRKIVKVLFNIFTFIYLTLMGCFSYFYCFDLAKYYY